MAGFTRALGSGFSAGSEAVSYFVGGIVIVAAVAVVTLSVDVGTVTDWLRDVLGLTFLGLLAGLVYTSLFAWIKVKDTRKTIKDRQFWFEIGLQAANGVTTLALTYTLLGIALGIGGLANQDLTPETIQVIIRDLTGHFSLAFMTTVVGLPASAALRALLQITHTRFGGS